MAKIYTAVRENGMFLEECDTLQEAFDAIKGYERGDKNHGNYEPDFYDIVDEDHCTVVFKIKEDIDGATLDELGHAVDFNTRWIPDDVKYDAENYGMTINDFVDRYLEFAGDKEEMK